MQPLVTPPPQPLLWHANLLVLAKAVVANLAGTTCWSLQVYHMFVNLCTTHAHPRLSKKHLALMLADNRARPAFRTSVDLEEGMVLGPRLDPKSGSMFHMRLL